MVDLVGQKIKRTALCTEIVRGNGQAVGPENCMRARAAGPNRKRLAKVNDSSAQATAKNEFNKRTVRHDTRVKYASEEGVSAAMRGTWYLVQNSTCVLQAQGNGGRGGKRAQRPMRASLASEEVVGIGTAR